MNDLHLHKMNISRIFLPKFRGWIAPLFGLLVSCVTPVSQVPEKPTRQVLADSVFIQEEHHAFPVGTDRKANEVRSIAVDNRQRVWIATADGIFRKEPGSSDWIAVLDGEDRGPAYAVAVDARGDVLLGTWNGLYSWHEGQTTRKNGPKPPISAIALHADHVYALGPNGIWQSNEQGWEEIPCGVARTVRDAVTDETGALWVATNAGLYRIKDGKTVLYQDTRELLSCYAKSIAFGPDHTQWVAVLGGVSVRKENKLLRNLTPAEGISSANVNCVRQSPDGTMWVGTDVGVVRYDAEYHHTLLFSKRWLLDDQVNALAFDREGNGWIATNKGVSQIRRRPMTLAQKQDYFYDRLMKRHIRPPWTCGSIRLDAPGDTAHWHPSDDDNDGEYTGGYLAMESFRYAVTKDPDALDKARKAFRYLRFLHEVTGKPGFFARSVIPTDWKTMHDPNRSFTERELAEELVKDPRRKSVEVRWHPSADGKWLWKGDTSSDEMDGHMMGYFFFYEYAAEASDKEEIRKHIASLMGGLMTNHFNLEDIDGTHTHWGVWSPDQLNRDPDWSSEKSLNSFELLAYLKLAAHVTGEARFQKAYQDLMEKEGYLDNAAQLNNKNPAWQIYFDRTMEGYIFPILIKYETDPTLKRFYQGLIDEWMKGQESGENLINNLTYALATGKIVNVPQTVSFLREIPLDLVDWHIDHTLREDVQLVRRPILEEMQVSELPPPAIRPTVRWDKNPWDAKNGNPMNEKEPVFWLWPYWMARYLHIIAG
ncbi:MAG: hypothetical protein LWW85_03705 [Marinilabiliales bacterium]|nr:hypothetical protein [Marinilabiliales bacterium]